MQEQKTTLKAAVTLVPNSKRLPKDLYLPMKKMSSLFNTILEEHEVDSLQDEGYLIKQWDVLQLHLRRASRDGIVSAISNIRFPSLTKIVLANNNIYSVEGLAIIFAPCLMELYIDKNYILDVRSIRKMQARYLFKISLQNNQIADASSLVQVESSLKKIILQTTRSKTFRQPIQFCAKFKNPQSQQYFQLAIKSKKRIVEKKIIESLQRKYEKKRWAEIFAVKSTEQMSESESEEMQEQQHQQEQQIPREKEAGQKQGLDQE